MEDDELAQIRDLFYVGFYDNCMSNLLNFCPQADSAQIEKEGLLCRSKLSLHEFDERVIQNNNAPPTKAVTLFNRFLNSPPGNMRQSVLNELRDLLNKSHDLTTTILLASAYAHEEDYFRSLELTENGTLEIMALRAMILILMKRYDLAEKICCQMKSVSDDSGITKLLSAWMNLINGNAEESFLTFGDIESECMEGSTYQTEKKSLALLNGKGISNMMRFKCREAAEYFEEAYKQHSKDVDTLVNLGWCYRNLHKHDAADRYYSELSTIFPDHPIVKKINSINEVFDAFQMSLA